MIIAKESPPAFSREGILKSADGEFQPAVQNHGGNLIYIDHAVEQEGNLAVGVSNGEHIVDGVIVPNQIFRAILEADFRHGDAGLLAAARPAVYFVRGYQRAEKYAALRPACAGRPS